MMKQYDSYKDSGVEWIGKIPSHWGSAPIKYTVESPYNSFIDGDWIESKVIVSDGIRYLTTGNVGALKYKEQGNGFISESTFKALNCSEVFPDDILISRLNEPIGRACIVPDLGYRIVVAVDNVIYRPDMELYDKKFLVYQMNCKPYADMANFIARGSTMSRVSRTTLGHFKLVVPPLNEQKEISNYLDNKCGKIDKAIATQEKRVELLKELRQNIITQAVTRGINPNAPLKDSGVEWIGEVPEHWKVMKMNHALRSISDVNHYMPDSVSEGYPYIMTGDLKEYLSEIDLDSCKQISVDDYKELTVKSKAQKGDVIFARYATIGTVCYVDVDKDFVVSYSCVTIKPNSSILDGLFLFYYLQTHTFFEDVSQSINSNTQGNVGIESLSASRLIVPSISEQQEIVTYIETQTARLDASIEKAEHQIELLQELKQSIITEVVTGKRKVV